MPTNSPVQVSESSRKWWTEYWRGVYGMPRAWAHKGESLVHAFEAVVEGSVAGTHLDMRDQALMLAGMAVEVMLKAIIVDAPHSRAIVTAKPPNRASTDRPLWDAFYSHDIVELAKHAGVSLSGNEAIIASKLTEFI